MAEFVSQFKVRHPGTRWEIHFGSYAGVEQFAVNELQRMAQAYLPYVLQTQQAQPAPAGHEGHLFLIGTCANNPWIRQLCADGRLTIPTHSEGYAIASLASPWSPERKIIVLAGHDANGVLYAVMEFNARILGVERFSDDPRKPGAALDEMPAFSVENFPRIADRGIWTWGYVIYDYRSFLDNMARLRMNMLTIWNDCPPVNIREVIEYAHMRGIRVVLGFHWGWGFEGVDIAKTEDVAAIQEQVLDNYERNYAGLPHDGIYFQTLTEHHETKRDGVPVAQLACNLVNRIGGALLKKHPHLKIQFGLHAISVLENYPCLEKLDRRISVVWEDAGVLPYGYEPSTVYVDDRMTANGLGSVEATIDYSKKLAGLRDRLEFACVPKGFGSLRWGAEFENHRSFILGERSKRFILTRKEQIQPRWNHYNALWLANYPQAVRFFREVLAVGPKRVTATALVEDSLFECGIQPGIALFANILWNPEIDEKLLPLLAHSNYHYET